jgi:hypothetical protein
VLIGESVANIGVEVAAFGICAEECPVTSRRDIEVSIEFAGAELNLEQVSTRIMSCGSQQSGVQGHSVHEKIVLLNRL